MDEVPTAGGTPVQARHNRTKGFVVAGVVGVLLGGAAIGLWAMTTGSETSAPPPPVTSSPVGSGRRTIVTPETATTAPPNPTTGGELSDASACVRWYDLRHFAGAGLINAPEVINKAAGIRDIAATPAVREPAARLLAAAEQKDLARLGAAIDELNAVCR